MCNAIQCQKVFIKPEVHNKSQKQLGFVTNMQKQVNNEIRLIISANTLSFPIHHISHQPLTPHSPTAPRCVAPQRQKLQENRRKDRGQLALKKVQWVQQIPSEAGILCTHLIVILSVFIQNKGYFVCFKLSSPGVGSFFTNEEQKKSVTWPSSFFRAGLVPAVTDTD